MSNYTQKVIITSKNPVKINAVSSGFTKAFPNTKFEFVAVAVSSGVSDQPMTDSETLLGAMNRIQNAKLDCKADFWVAIEGGIEEIDGELVAFAYILISTDSKNGISKTATFVLPQKVSELIKQGMELGDADDVVFGGNNSKQKNGSVGILTKDLITRTSFYDNSVILALIPFLNEDLY